jgi:hypothetical protein
VHSNDTDDDDYIICSDHDTNVDGIDAILKQLDYFDIRSSDGIDGTDDERISTQVTNSDHDIQPQYMGFSTDRGGKSSTPVPSKSATTSYTNNKERAAIDAILAQLFHYFDAHPEPENTNFITRNTNDSVGQFDAVTKRDNDEYDFSARDDGTIVSSSYGEEIIKVIQKELFDSYGDKGIFTGAMLKTTGMPHGFGKKIYEDNGRIFEGGW